MRHFFSLAWLHLKWHAVFHDKSYRTWPLLSKIRFWLSAVRHLSTGWKWMVACVRLIMYSAILWPGFLSMIIFYFFSPRVVRNVPYGRELRAMCRSGMSSAVTFTVRAGMQPRNQLDLYIPYRKWLGPGKKVPVVIFVTGGAWMIGYKAWGALLGRRLSQQGVVVACLDYRNFPQGRASDMVADVTRGIGWVLRHIHGVGGDRRQVYLVGQSCGGHLSLMALYRQAARAAELHGAEAARGGAFSPGSASDNSRGPSDNGQLGSAAAAGSDAWRIPSHDSVGIPVDAPVPHSTHWDPSALKGFVALSCPLDVESLVEHFERRGLSGHLFRCIMSHAGDAEGLAAMNPARHLREAPAALAARLPPILCLHGTEDATVPYSESLKLQTVMQAHGIDAKCKLYPSCTHTWPLIEGPMAGRDQLTADILQLVHGASDYSHSYSLLPFPGLTTWLARQVCPF